MKTATYPKIGSKVSYIRQIPPKGDIEIGDAIVEAICLDMDKRVMAHLAKPSPEANAPYDRFNVDLSCLEPSEAFVEKFKDLADNIQRTGLEGNAKAKEIIDEHNAMIELFRGKLLGEPVEFETLGAEDVVGKPDANG